MPRHSAFERRRFLQGLGVCVALPALESLLPNTARAAGTKAAAAAKSRLATTPTGAPLRTAFLYVPNGVNVESWRPVGEGADYKLSPTLEPLADLKSHFQVLTGLEQQNGWSGGDGAGDHARANASILTGARPKKTAGADIKLGVSIDQFAARQLADLTRFPSLELSCDGIRKAGVCDSGYSCAYQFNLSWRSESSPVAPESNPRLLFERLFGSGNEADLEANYRLRQARQRSILDFVRADAQQLNKELGRNDKQKLDEYLTGVREIERRIERAEQFGPLANPGVAAPNGVPPGYRDHLRLMADLLVVAFQTDATRMATFLLAHDGSNRTFNEIGVTDGHHTLSHHQNDKQKLEKIAKIDRFYTAQLAYFLEKLGSTKDVDGRTLLDNSMIVYASGLSDGNRHRHDDLPVILAGHGGGALQSARHVNVGQKTPMNNLYMSMLDILGIPAERFGDSTGKLPAIIS